VRADYPLLILHKVVADGSNKNKKKEKEKKKKKKKKLLSIESVVDLQLASIDYARRILPHLNRVLKHG
jgi:hypothetical protein